MPSSRRDSPRYRPRIFDLAVLVAASAVGFALTKLLKLNWSESRLYINPWMEFTFQATRWIVRTAPLMALWTVALLIVWARHTRGAQRRPRFQPGFLALAAATAALAFTTMVYAVFALLSDQWGDREWTFVVLMPMGVAVASIWLVNGALGCVRCVRDILDFAGVIVGVYWAAFSISFVIGFALGWI